MIQQLKDIEGMHGYRSYLDTRTGDIIIQGHDIDFFGSEVYWEAIVRGKTNQVDARDIHHKIEVVKRLRCPHEPYRYAAETLSESDLDGILRDYANDHKREETQ